MNQTQPEQSDSVEVTTEMIERGLDAQFPTGWRNGLDENLRRQRMRRILDAALNGSRS